MPAPSWRVLRCGATLSPSLSNRPDISRQSLYLAADLLPANSNGELQSSRARTLLSDLAAGLGMHCSPELWSARGSGAPTHPELLPGWHAGISHKCGTILVGLAAAPFGLDLECANVRHAHRLEGLIEMLPEPWVRRWIHQSPYPQTAFYHAWTLYEALFKFTSAANSSKNRHHNMGELKLADPVFHASAWHGASWTLGIISAQDLQPTPDPAHLLCGLSPLAPMQPT
jgi:hypothetical protein